MLLRDVVPADVDVYVRLRCDPAMTADVGGPRRPDDMPAKVARDIADAVAGAAWNLMILPGNSRPDMVAGTVTVYSREHDGQARSEIGWMVLPEFQGRGLAKQAVALVLQRAKDERRWGLIHAFTDVRNVASNALCRSLRLDLQGLESYEFSGRIHPVNHWTVSA